MGSTRLPGKVLMSLCKKPLLYHLIERVKRAKFIDRVIIATTEKAEDDRIEKFGKQVGIDVFRGNAEDVLDRYYRCAKKFGGDVIVRITGDCPFIDPAIIDETIKCFLDNNFDYVSNAYPVPSYPDGLDVEVFTFEALESAWRKAGLSSEREHATSYIWKNMDKIFSLGSVKYPIDLSGKRWTVDNKADFKFASEIYDNLYSRKPFFDMNDILQLLKRKPELEDINKGIGRNEGYAKSLKGDKK